ncbi:MAG: hypothetical protein P1V51_24985 [Deltaproteobacteria bacterium]|nr:hypothetical protein [Deltaproteobacteria bacterium]
MRRYPALLLLGLLIVAGCGDGGGGNRQIGQECGEDPDCAEGLRCILYGARDIGESGLECTTARLCSIPCTSTTECVDSLGDGHICLSDCHEGSCLRGSSSGG